MFSHSTPQDSVARSISAMRAEDFASFMYCQQIALTYLAVAQFEDMLVTAMLACRRVNVSLALGKDAEEWEKLIARRDALQASTLGSLISILERHPIDLSDLRYLRWLKDKRDYFVHRLFHDGAWPGDLDSEGCRYMARRLVAIQHWLRRGQRRIWFIFQRAKLVVVKDLGEDGLLAMNADLFEDDPSK